MRGIFARIFGWLWLTIALVAIAAVLTIMILRAPEDDGPPWRRMADRMLGPDGAALVGVLEADGAEAVRERLDRWAPRVYLFDEAGASIGGDQPSPHLRGVVERARSSDRAVVEDVNHELCAATVIVGRDGRRFVFARSVFSGRPGAPWPNHPIQIVLGEADLIVTVLGTTILISGLLAYGLARQFAAPLHDLRRTTQQFAAGELSARSAPQVSGRRDEFGQLSRDFDAMAGRIEKLLTLERQLLRDVSHELRSPLARLHVALDLARASPGVQAEELHARIEREIRRLDELIGQVLNLARIEAESGQAAVESAALHEVARAVAEDGGFEAAGQGKRVVLKLCEPVRVRGAASLLHCAIENVVRNAIRHSPADSSVEMMLTVAQDSKNADARLTVRDHGPGVPEANLADIFRPFYRVGEARQRSDGGVGLGLSITQRIVHAAGGSVIARNAAGGGLIVEIALPVSAENQFHS